MLVGLMATGKSSVGRRVAEHLERPLLDSDDLIEARCGRTVREIFATDGEAAFRAIETDVLREAMASPEAAVVAGAGGVVLAEANRSLLSADDVDVVWLRADVDTLVERIARSRARHRPLLDDHPEGRLRAMHDDRQALYAAVADHAIDVDDLGVADVAAAVVDWLDRPRPTLEGSR